VTITGNTTDHNYSSGIYAVNASHWTISGNYCRDNNIDGKDTGAGLIIDLADQVVATQNVCTSSEHKQTAGILVGHGGVGAPGITDVALFNNVLTGHGKNDLLNFYAGAVENYAAGSVYKY
jgi:parallel beta-helix repeat protein